MVLNIQRGRTLQNLIQLENLTQSFEALNKAVAPIGGGQVGQLPRLKTLLPRLRITCPNGKWGKEAWEKQLLLYGRSKTHILRQETAKIWQFWYD